MIEYKKRQEILEDNNFYYSTAGLSWSDGLLLGNGNMGAVAYAPNSMEWLINKLDVFDGRVRKIEKMTPHSVVMNHMKENGLNDSFFLGDMEKQTEKVGVYSVSPLILKLHLGNGDLGWSAQVFPNVSQYINLEEGELYQRADAHFMHTDVKSIVPRGTNIFTMRVSGCAVFDWMHTLEVFRPYHKDMDMPKWEKGEAGEVFFTQKFPDNENEYAVAVKVVMREKDINRVNYPLPEKFDYDARVTSVSEADIAPYNANISCCGDMDVFVCVCSSFSYENPLLSAKKELEEAIEKGFEALEEENKKWWKEYWAKSFADFGKYSEIQKYFNFSMYELACSFEKAPMPALNGLCCGPVSYTMPGVSSPFYTHDQNAQIPSMPLLVLNHPELTGALVDTYYNVKEKIYEHTKELFGDISGKGLFLPLNMNQKGQENPTGIYRYTLCGSAYTGLVLSLIWKYTHDKELVKEKIYPLLCDMILFYSENMLTFGEDEKYHLDPTVPPEIFTMTKDDVATMSMLRSCIITAMEISSALEDNNPEYERWTHILEHFPDIAKRKEDCWWSGPDIPEEHFCFGGHLLYPFFPSEAYVSKADKETTRKTLDYIGRNALERSFADLDGGFHYLHDWSWLLTSMAEVRCEQKNFFNELERGLYYFAKPNGLFSHDSIIIGDCNKTEANYENAVKSEGHSADPGRGLWWYELGRCATPNPNAKKIASPVLEGNSIFLLCAAETLLQSYDGIIRIFPCVPEDFTGSFDRFLAQGGFEVSARAEEGKLKEIRIKSLVGGTLKIYDTASVLCNYLEGAERSECDGEIILSKKMDKDEEIYINL